MQTDQAIRDATRDEALREELRRLRALLDAYIADRETTERALQASEERYRSLFERAAFGIYRATPEGRFLQANPALVEMLGYDTVEELLALDIGRDVYRRREDREALFRHLEHRDPDPWVDVEWKRKDGTIIDVRLIARTVRDGAGRLLWCESIAENVTERRRREEMARRQERLAALGTMLAGVAHELNNPLAAIKGFVQLMLRHPEVVDQRNALDTIHRETERAAQIVRDLLVFARRSESRERSVVDLNQIVRYILATRRYAMETRGIACTADLAPDAAAVVADPVQLEQVVLNLVLNAEQALAAECDAPSVDAPARRRDAGITVRTWVEGSQVGLAVEDNGPGVPAADLPRIWDPFWTTKPEGEGTGLGLSVVHGIVAAHGGTVEAEPADGRGLRVVIRLPDASHAPLPATHGPADRAVVREVADESSRTGARPDAASATPTPLDILLIDDEESILGFVREYLEARGHAVLTATDGEQALHLAGLARFDVVICDLRMPGLDGDEVVRRMREHPGYESTRFVISTGDNASGSAARRIAELRPDAVLAKPYGVEQLRQIVEHPPA